MAEKQLAEDTGPLSLGAGAAVTIHGLRGRPELNGKSGTVMQWMPARGRYEVQVPGGGYTHAEWPRVSFELIGDLSTFQTAMRTM